MNYNFNREEDDMYKVYDLCVIVTINIVLITIYFFG